MADPGSHYEESLRGYQREMAEQRRQLAEYRQKVAESDAIVNSVASSLSVYDANGYIIYQNAAARQILGYSDQDRRSSLADRIQGVLRAETADGSPLRPEEAPGARALRGETVREQVMLVHRPGRRVWLSVCAAPIRDEVGNTTGAVVTSADITRLREAEEMREDFLRGISHDLRTPLTVIQGQAQLLLRALDRAGIAGRVRRSAEAIIAASKRMNMTIGDLVDSTRRDPRQFALDKEPIDLAPFLMQLLEGSCTALEVGRVRLSIAPSLPPVLADPVRLERIFTSLFANALKYSPKDREVLVAGEAAPDGEVAISVTDQGPGIAMDELPHVFERFYRVGEARKADGLGLGLYISRMLVEAHGGKIWVESEPGRGTTFHVTLPTA